MKTTIALITMSAFIAATTAAFTTPVQDTKPSWVQCNVCKGSGWTGTQRCYPCGGDGKIGATPSRQTQRP